MKEADSVVLVDLVDLVVVSSRSASVRESAVSVDSSLSSSVYAFWNLLDGGGGDEVEKILRRTLWLGCDLEPRL